MKPGVYMVIIGGLFFIAALLYFVLTIGSKPAVDPGQEVPQTEQDPSNTQDSDGDGLADWEEDLYGSSKHRADTDGDGINDADEIAQGSDPTTFYSQNVSGDVAVIQEETDQYQFAQRSNPSSVEDFVGSVEEEIGNQSQEVAEEFEAEQNRDTPLRSCINTVGLVVQESLVTTPETSATIGQYLIGETANTAPVEALRDAQMQAATRLANLELPDCPQLEVSYNALQDTYTKTGELLDTILDTPPATPEQYQLWQEYNQVITRWLQEVHAIRTLAEENQISYESSEPGYIFTQSSVQ